MNVLILAYTLETYATNRLASHFRARGHQVSLASPLECSLEILSANTGVLHKGQPLSNIDAVILRGLTYIHNGIVVSRTLETSLASRFLQYGALCFNSPNSKLIATNKYATLQQLADAGIPVPRSFLCPTSDDIEQIVEQLGTPVILKTLDGTWGVGVVRCDSLESARSTFDALQMSGQPFLVQKYISESKGQDVRVLVLGNRVLGAMRCFPKKGDFRSNIARGAQAERIALPAAYEELAVSAAQTIGVDLAGVDLIESDEGPLVLEVNPVPGFEKIDSMCSIDSALAMVEYIEARHALRAGPSVLR